MHGGADHAAGRRRLLCGPGHRLQDVPRALQLQGDAASRRPRSTSSYIERPVPLPEQPLAVRSPTDDGCLVDFYVDFEFQSKMLQKLIGAAVQRGGPPDGRRVRDAAPASSTATARCRPAAPAPRRTPRKLKVAEGAGPRSRRISRAGRPAASAMPPMTAPRLPSTDISTGGAATCFRLPRPVEHAPSKSKARTATMRFGSRRTCLLHTSKNGGKGFYSTALTTSCSTWKTSTVNSSSFRWISNPQRQWPANHSRAGFRWAIGGNRIP